MHSVDQHHHVAAHVDGRYTQNQVESLLVEPKLADFDQNVVKLHGQWVEPVDHIHNQETDSNENDTNFKTVINGKT